MIRLKNLGDLRYPDKPWSGEDWLLVSKLAARGVRMVANPEPLVLMRRTQGMESLTANQRAPEDYLRAVGLVKNLQSWLKAQGITRFRHLDKKALANKYFYGYKENTGKQKINLLRRTICLDPLNKKYWAEIKRIIQRKISSLRD